MRGLPSWVAAATLLVAANLLPWTWGIEGAYFSRAVGAPASAGVFAVWQSPRDFGVATIVFVLVALAFVVRLPRWAVVVAALAGAVACAVTAGAIGGALLLSLAALVLGVVAAYAPAPAAARPWLVPLGAAAVLLGVLFAPRVLWSTDWFFAQANALSLYDQWSPALLASAAAAVALTPVLPGGRTRAAIPVAFAAFIAIALDTEPVLDEPWAGRWLAVGALAAAAAALALHRPRAARATL